MTVLDVGQGDAILVEGSRGGRLLIDGGPDPDRLLVELDRRIPPWDRRLDAVVLSHPHEDHVAGLAMLLERYRVGRTFEPGMLGPGPGYAAWAAELAGRPTPGGLLAAGDRLSVDDIALEVLWPMPGSVPREPPDTGTGINNVSIVLLGSVAGRRFLLTGDVEEEVDPELLARLGHVDLLKIAHHGSRTASTDAFLDAVDPTVAVASAGTGNPYGHPSPATLSRIEARGARVLRTDRDGSVSVTFETTAITVRSSGGRPRPTPRPTRSGALGGRRAWPSSAPCHSGPQVPNPTSRAAHESVLRPRSGWPIRSCTIGSMTVPDRIEAARLVRSLEPPEWLLRHSRAVAEVAAFLAARTAGRGVAIDRRLAEIGGPPPRRRQGAAEGRSPPGPGPWARLRALARGARPRGAWAVGRAPPDHPTARRRLVRDVAPRVATRGPDRGLCGQARPPAARVPRRSLRIVAPTPLGRGTATPRPRSAAGRQARGGRVRGGRGPPGGGPAAALDGRRLQGRGSAMSPAAPPSVALLWGDDDLATARAVDGIAAAHAAGSGIPLERWEVRGDAGAATDLIGQIVERLSTPVMFGGGTMAVVNNVGPLLRRNDHRDALFGAIGTLAPGNAICFVEATPSGTKAVPQKRLADAVTAAGGIVREFRSPKGGGLTAFIEAEARERRVALGGRRGEGARDADRRVRPGG